MSTALAAPTLSSLYDEHHDGAPAEDVADKLATILRLTRTQREVLMPLLIGYCANRDRCRVRHVERAEAPQPGQQRRTTYRDLLALTFALPDGTVTTWGAATIDQHQQRIDLLAKQRDGLQVTINQHQAAIEQIVAAGASCLAEVQK